MIFGCILAPFLAPILAPPGNPGLTRAPPGLPGHLHWSHLGAGRPRGCPRAPKMNARGTKWEAISRLGDSKNHKNWSPVGEMYYKINQKFNAFLDRENAPLGNAQGTKMEPKLKWKLWRHIDM